MQDDTEFPEDLDYTTHLDRISARWGGFEDGETGILYYRWGLGTEPGLVDEWPWEHVSLNLCKLLYRHGLKNCIRCHSSQLADHQIRQAITTVRAVSLVIADGCSERPTEIYVAHILVYT